MNLKRKKMLIALISVLAVASSYAWIARRMSPEAALKRFYTYGDDPDDAVAEDMLMDPLILAGEKVVPLVISEIKNKEMPRRRYAIGFLGNGSYKQALPALEEILQVISEEDIFRGDAIEAIYLIEETLGLQYAEKYQDSPDFLGRRAKDILYGRVPLNDRRSYHDALTRKHD